VITGASPASAVGFDHRTRRSPPWRHEMIASQGCLLDLVPMFPQQEHLPSSGGTRVLNLAVHAQETGGFGLSHPSLSILSILMDA
jgi:hypothetical protein